MPHSAFVGSRGSSVDGTLDDHGKDCSWNGWPDVKLGTNMHNEAVDQPWQTLNTSAEADGIVGGAVPTAIFYLTMDDNATSSNRYWTYMIVPKPDMQGSREQGVWIRFQQVECSGAKKEPPCKLVDWPEYWDSYWYARFPGANRSNVNAQTITNGGINASTSSGFYSTLLEIRTWWKTELAKEKMMQLSLPSPASTNGTWLLMQAKMSFVRSMITRERTFHPRAGVTPGFGNNQALNGLHDVFVSTATAAMAWGAVAYSKGVIDNHFKFYVRPDGAIWFRSVQLPATARMLTVLAQYYQYNAGGEEADDASAFLLTHFAKAKALAEWIIAKRTASLQHGASDPRYGIPAGGDDDTNAGSYAQRPATFATHTPLSYYSSTAEAYRAFTEMGTVWSAIGAQAKRSDVVAHGATLLEIALLLRRDLETSMNRTVVVTPSGERCWAFVADSAQDLRAADVSPYRAYSELLYSGVMSKQQVSDIYLSASGKTSCKNATGGTRSRFLTLGSPGPPGTGSATVVGGTSYGFAYGLLQHDFVDKFLLHYYALSAHGYTRGTFSSPFSSNWGNRSDNTAATFATASVHVAPTYLSWALTFTNIETQTLWIAKATPREWLSPGEVPLVANRVTTLHGGGRISFSMQGVHAKNVVAEEETAFAVHVNVTLPASFAHAPPKGGLRIRIRAPLEYAGKMSAVTVGGKPWSAFDAKAETIDISASAVTEELIASGFPAIVVTF